MKIRTKLFIAFFLIIGLPMILLSVGAITFTSYHMDELYALQVESATAEEIVQAVKLYAMDVREYISNLMILICLVVPVIVICLVLWIYHSIVTPIYMLQLATKNIKNGNLDFEVEVHNQDEIGELCEDFEEMRIRLKDNAEEKLRTEQQQKELISNISHDLKTPITAIKGYVEGLIDGVADTPEKQNKYLQTVYSKAIDMDRLINELSFYAKIDTNKIPYTFNRINVVGYFEDCAEDLGRELEDEGFGFSYQNYVDDSVQMIADAEQIKRVINNIVGNSKKYSDKAETTIRMTVKDVGDFVQIEIEDNGRGIAAKDLPYIFDRFYRTDASRNSSKGGSGIGLSIVKKIMEDHGGKIWVTSKEGIGTVMYLVLRKYQQVPVNE
jgi:signal transduction histidine kinase